MAGAGYVGVEEFVENTKQYAEGISPTPAMEAGGDDDDDDDEGPVKNPDELPLHQKVLFLIESMHIKTWQAYLFCVLPTWPAVRTNGILTKVKFHK